MRLTKKRADNGKYYLSGLAEVLNCYPKGYGLIQVGHAVDKLAEYEELEEQNRLLKLPCAVGDTVYTACSWGIESGIVGSIEIISDRIFVNNTRGQMIGEAKNIFLTREAAEAALKELERGKGE